MRGTAALTTAGLRASIALGLLACVMAAPACAGTLDFVLRGTNPGGKGNYRGTVSLTEVSVGPGGEKSGVVTWRVGSSAPVVGVALSTADAPERLSISFPNRPVPGVALGTVMADGSLELIWYAGGRGGGTETWTPAKR